jgi:hypothetical protein
MAFRKPNSVEFDLLLRIFVCIALSVIIVFGILTFPSKQPAALPIITSKDVANADIIYCKELEGERAEVVWVIADGRMVRGSRDNCQQTSNKGGK